MPETVTFINSNGQSITLGNSRPLSLLSIIGTGGNPTDVQTQKSAFQDGSNYLVSVLQERTIQMEAVIIGDEDTIFSIRKSLVSVFNPKLGVGELVYSFAGQEKRLECVVDLTPQFPTGDDNRRSGVFQKVIFDLIAPNPFWTDNFVSGELLSQSVPNFSFDWILNDENELETLGTNRTKIINIGDVETPVEIVFKGPASNPVITNETTGEFIAITKDLLDGESIMVSTRFGDKYVLFQDSNGAVTNAFGDIDLDSTFWNLAVGENDIKYTTDAGIDTASMIISYRNRYVGV